MAEKNNIMTRDKTTAENYSAMNWRVPPIDVFENEDELLLIADLPGVDKKNLTIKLNNDTLELTGHYKGATKGTMQEQEIFNYDFKRSFKLPQGIKSDNINAKFNDGVLNLHLPKSPDAKPVQIKIT